MPLSDYGYNTWIVKSRIAKEMQLLDSEITLTNGKTVLDAGSSANESFINEYTSRGLKAISMDISINSLSVARQNTNSGDVYLLAGDVNNIPLAAESVDIVFLCEVLEHLNAPERALKEAHRVLRKGGYILIDVPWLHEIYRPLSAITLRNLFAYKNGKSPLLLKIMFKNLDEIDGLNGGDKLKRTWIGSLFVNMTRIFPTFRSFDPEYFVYNYYHGTMPEGNMHLQFRYPQEWTKTIHQAGFRVLRKTGTHVTPLLLDRSRLCNLLFSKLEHRMSDTILLRQSQILIMMAKKA